MKQLLRHLVLPVILLCEESPAAIVHVALPNPPNDVNSCLSAGATVTCPFDIDDDGATDFTFVSGEGQFYVFTSALAAFNYYDPGPIIGAAGLIFASIYNPRGIDYTINPHTGLGLVATFQGGTFGLSYFNGENGGGPIYNQHVYLPFALLQAPGELDGARYGWIRVQEIAGLGGVMWDYAYETEPDTAIIAGQIPEPATPLLLVLIAGGLAASRRRVRFP